MSDVDFTGLLETKTDTIRKPTAYPSGTYVVSIEKYELKAIPNETATPYVQYTARIVHVGEDVSADELAIADPSGKLERPVYLDFYLTENDRWKIVEFVQTADLDTTGTTLRSVITLPLQRKAKVKLGPNPKSPMRNKVLAATMKLEDSDSAVIKA